MHPSEIISELDSLFFEYINFNHLIINTYKYPNNDVRVSFYKLSYHVIDATINLIMFSNFGFRDKHTLESFYKSNKIQNRFRRYPSAEKWLDEGRYNIDQFIAYGYFISIFHIFENSFRILSQLYNATDYKPRITSIDWIFNHFIKEFKNDSPSLSKINTDFFNYLTVIRNSIHTNGKYLPRDKDLSKSFTDLDGNSVKFSQGQVITVNDVWENNIKMTKKFSTIYNELILIPKFRSTSLIEDSSAY